MTIIKDGAGSGDTAKVDSSNKLEVRSIDTTEFQSGIIDGRVFVVSSGVVTLTTACASGLLYLKNCDCRDMLISKLVINLGNSTGGCGNFTSTITICPTGGTLICCGAVAPAANLNFGSGLSACVTSTAGTEGSTVTGGIPVSDIHALANRREIVDVALLPKGVSLAMSITPPAGNCSVDVNINIAIQFVETR